MPFNPVILLMALYLMALELSHESKTARIAKYNCLLGSANSYRINGHVETYSFLSINFSNLILNFIQTAIKKNLKETVLEWLPSTLVCTELQVL